MNDPTGPSGTGGQSGHVHHPEPLAPQEARVIAIETVLEERGLLNRSLLDRVVETYEHTLGPMNGARVVAHAWVDAAYKGRLLANGTSAVRELGYGGPEGEHIVIVENTDRVHNLVVCTLCSCYPWPLLGLPPNWYKSPPYRSRAVREPRSVLAEFGTELPAETEVRVWDSSADARYLVLPQRPQGTDDLHEEQLAALVTRDGMIGVSRL